MTRVHSYQGAGRLARRGRALALSLAAMVAASGVAAQGLSVPSGQPLSFLEFISEEGGDLVRFRFLAPQIGAGFDYATVFPDFQALCDQQVMPILSENGIAPRQIVLSMSAQDIPFGKDDPEVLQFFEVFRPESGACIWEEF